MSRPRSLGFIFPHSPSSNASLAAATAVSTSLIWARDTSQIACRTHRSISVRTDSHPVTREKRWTGHLCIQNCECVVVQFRRKIKIYSIQNYRQRCTANKRVTCWSQVSKHLIMRPRLAGTENQCLSISLTIKSSLPQSLLQSNFIMNN